MRAERLAYSWVALWVAVRAVQMVVCWVGDLAARTAVLKAGSKVEMRAGESAVCWAGLLGPEPH